MYIISHLEKERHADIDIHCITLQPGPCCCRCLLEPSINLTRRRKCGDSDQDNKEHSHLIHLFFLSFHSSHFLDCELILCTFFLSVGLFFIIIFTIVTLKHLNLYVPCLPSHLSIYLHFPLSCERFPIKR